MPVHKHRWRKVGRRMSHDPVGGGYVTVLRCLDCNEEKERAD